MKAQSHYSFYGSCLQQNPFFQEADQNSSTVLEGLGKSHCFHGSNSPELRFQNAINSDIILSVKPSVPVYERPNSSEYEYPAWPHIHHGHINVHQPKSKTEKTDDTASNGYFTPYVRSPENSYEDDSLRYQSLIHHGGKRNVEKGEGVEMPYVIMPEDPNRSVQNSLPSERNLQEHYTNTKKRENANIEASDQYFTPLTRLPRNKYDDFHHYQSLIHRG